MWLRFIKPLILSLTLFIILQSTTLCLTGYYYLNYNWLIVIAFFVLLLGITITYQSCAKDKTCKTRIKLIVFAIPPIFLFWGLVGFLFFNTSFYLREIFLIVSTLAFFVIFSEIFSKFTHHAHDLIKFFIIFMLFDSILELVHYFRLPLYFIPLLTLTCAFILMHHMFWRLSALKKNYSLTGLGIGAALGIFAWIAAIYWPMASYFILALMVMSLYYVAWGLLHHHIEHHLSKKVALDYIFIGAFVFLMALGLVFLS